MIPQLHILSKSIESTEDLSMLSNVIENSYKFLSVPQSKVAKKHKVSKILPFQMSRLKSSAKECNQSIGSKLYYSKREGIIISNEAMSIFSDSTCKPKVHTENFIYHKGIQPKEIESYNLKSRQSSVGVRKIDFTIDKSLIPEITKNHSFIQGK